MPTQTEEELHEQQIQELEAVTPQDTGFCVWGLRQSRASTKFLFANLISYCQNIGDIRGKARLVKKALELDIL